MSLQETISFNVKTEREMAGLTQDKLCELAGICSSILSRIEGGHGVPQLKTLISISNVLNISLDYLCGIVKERK